MKRLLASGLTILLTLAYIVLRIRGHAFTAVFFAFSLPYLLSNSAVAWMLLLSLRQPPKEVDEGWGIFTVSLLAANLPILLGLSRVHLQTAVPNALLTQLAVLGSLSLVPFYLMAVATLGRNLTVLPEAHTLRTDGVYAFSRHPLYATYTCWYVLQVLLYQTWAILLISVLQIAFQVVRARREEALLSQVFPEYEAYRRRVGWFGPKRRCQADEKPSHLT